MSILGSIVLFFLIHFNVPFKIISAHMRRCQTVGGAKTGEPREKPPDTPASRPWLVSHVARAGLEPTSDTAVRGNIVSSLMSNLVKIIKMNLHPRKSSTYIDENKGTDQLCSNCTADQHLFFFYYTDSAIPLLFKSKVSGF